MCDINPYVIGVEDSNHLINPIDNDTNILISFSEEYYNSPFAINYNGTNPSTKVLSITTPTNTEYTNVKMQPYNNMNLYIKVKSSDDLVSRTITYTICDFYIIPYYHKYNSSLLNGSPDKTFSFTNIMDDAVKGEFITRHIISDTLKGSQYPTYIYTCSYIVNGNNSNITDFIKSIDSPKLIKNPFQPYNTNGSSNSTFICSNMKENIPQVIIFNTFISTNDVIGNYINTNFKEYNTCLENSVFRDLKDIYIPNTSRIYSYGTIILNNPVIYDEPNINIKNDEMYMDCNPIQNDPNDGSKVYSEIVGSASSTDLSRAGLTAFISYFMLFLCISVFCYIYSELFFIFFIFKLINKDFEPIQHNDVTASEVTVSEINYGSLNNNKENLFSLYGSLIIFVLTVLLFGFTLIFDSYATKSTAEYSIGYGIIFIFMMMSFVVFIKQSDQTTKLFEIDNYYDNFIDHLTGFFIDPINILFEAFKLFYTDLKNNTKYLLFNLFLLISWIIGLICIIVYKDKLGVTSIPVLILFIAELPLIYIYGYFLQKLYLKKK